MDTPVLNVAVGTPKKLAPRMTTGTGADLTPCSGVMLKMDGGGTGVGVGVAVGVGVGVYVCVGEAVVGRGGRDVSVGGTGVDVDVAVGVPVGVDVGVGVPVGVGVGVDVGVGVPVSVGVGVGVPVSVGVGVRRVEVALGESVGASAASLGVPVRAGPTTIVGTTPAVPLGVRK